MTTNGDEMRSAVYALALAVVLLSWRLTSTTNELRRTRAKLGAATAKLGGVTARVLDAVALIIKGAAPGSNAWARSVELRRALEELEASSGRRPKR